MAVVSVAIIISFHIKSQPSDIERRFAFPFGMIFWLLSLACLGSGLANYIKTVNKYAKRQALVQSGWKTQVVGLIMMTSIDRFADRGKLSRFSQLLRLQLWPPAYFSYL